MAKIWPCDDDESTRFPIFTRANTGEVFNDAATPLTWSRLGMEVYEGGYRDGLYRIGVFTPDDFKPEGHGEVVACFGGYVYINVSVSRVLAVRTPGMTSEAIDQSFFGEHPDVRPYKAHPDDENEACTARMVEWMTSLFTATEVPDEAGHRAHIDQIVAGRPDLTTLSEAELLARYRWLSGELRPVFATHIVNLYAANIVAGAIAQVGAAVGASELVAKVTAGVGDVDSAQQSFDLWRLSRVIRESPQVSAEFDAGIDGVIGRLEALSDPAAATFLAGWQAFLDAWGFLGPSVWELRSPTYGSHPEIPLLMLNRARHVDDAQSPEARGASLASDRRAAVDEISRRLEGTDAQAQFLGAANVAPLFLPAREATKVQCTRLVEQARMVMRELGGRLVERGVLPRWQDVLLLMDSEVDGFIADPDPWKAVVDERRELLTTLESKWPPFLFDGPPPPLSEFTDRADDTLVPEPSGKVLVGIGASPGTHTGPAKVVTSLEDDIDFDPGDVLVAMTTDSSWGPLFLTAGAVVCQTGAAISHAAIVSRELGIPAAVSVPGCTTGIANGTIVTVDGNAGTVTVH